jgi:hypothetical protein
LQAYFVNIRGWLDGSSLEGWIAVDIVAITTPAKKVIEPIQSKGRWPRYRASVY